MQLKGHAKIKSLTNHTENMFGEITVIHNQLLKVIDRNKQGDCMCLLPSEDNLIDVDHRDIEAFFAATPAQNPLEQISNWMRSVK